MYQNYSILADFFRSLNMQTDQQFAVFLTDVSDTKQKINPPPYCTILPTQNRGYAYTINNGIIAGVAEGYTQYCVMNSDVVFDEHFVAHVKESLETHIDSIIGGKIYYAPGYEFHKDRYSKDDVGKVIWYAGGKIDWNNVLTPHTGVDEVDNGQFNSLEATEFITGCLMAFDKKVIDEIGTWDESYFMYYEDADYCERAKQKSIDLYFDPSIVMYHKNAQSTGGSGSRKHVRMQRWSQLKFGLRYAPFRTKLHLIKNYVLAFLTGCI